MAFTINFLIFGDRPDHGYRVDVSDGDGEQKLPFLKDRIKEVMHPRLDHIAAADLELFTVDIPFESDRLREFETGTEMSLLPNKRLKMFQGRSENHVHVIVKAAPPESKGLHLVAQLLWINCFILGQMKPFTVKISMGSNNISILKEDIKRMNPQAVGNIDSKDLKLWRADTPVDNLSSIDYPTDPELGNTTLLSEVFQPILDSQRVHAVVHVPGHPGSWLIADRGLVGMRDTVTALNQTFEKTCNDIATALAPSDSAKSPAYPKSQLDYSIHDGRYKADAPRSSIGPPIELFHPVFGHFLDGIRCNSDGYIPEDIVCHTTKYMQNASGNYANELCRRKTLNPILSSVLGFNVQVVENEDKTKSDGIVEGFMQSDDHHTFLFLLKEDKNELGDGGSDPSTQAGLAAARTWVQPRLNGFLKATACPTFLIANAGPWFAVLGFVFTERVIVQRLTDFIWVGIDSTLSRSHVNRVARMFYVLKTSLDKLKVYYETCVIQSPQPAPTRYFPSITTYPDENGLQVQFRYLGYLERGLDCVTLHAETLTGPIRHIVVKFVESYSEQAHRILAEKGRAPRLLYHGSMHFYTEQPSYDSVSMVVMEYIDGDTFALAKSKMSKGMIRTVRTELKNALTLLHEKQLVFGDLRPPNVMITKEKKVMLIDFDWAGIAGLVQYPHQLSSAVKWPEGVRALGPIRQEHDLAMLDKLFAA